MPSGEMEGVDIDSPELPNASTPPYVYDLSDGNNSPARKRAKNDNSSAADISSTEFSSLPSVELLPRNVETNRDAQNDNGPSSAPEISLDYPSMSNLLTDYSSLPSVELLPRSIGSSVDEISLNYPSMSNLLHTPASVSPLPSVEVQPKSAESSD